jgi:hypothetical protein
MALERRNPLPVGRYWCDVFEDRWFSFESWINLNVQLGSLKVLNQENHEDEDQPRRWYLFEVLQPNSVAWLGPGLPTIAEKGIEHSDDTVQRPPTATLSTTEKLIAAGAIVGGAVALKYLLSGFFSKGGS